MTHPPPQDATARSGGHAGGTAHPAGAPHVAAPTEPPHGVHRSPARPAAGHRTGHSEARTAPGRASWRDAAQATLHCLTGCAIGEVLGMVIGTWLGWQTGPTVALAVALAFVFGYALTMRPLLRTGLGFRTALAVALAADTVSITVMEVLDNAVMLVVPGAMEAGLASGLFWGSLAFALVVAFALTVPVNRWLIARGRGHALVHGHHH